MCTYIHTYMPKVWEFRNEVTRNVRRQFHFSQFPKYPVTVVLPTFRNSARSTAATVYLGVACCSYKKSVREPVYCPEYNINIVSRIYISSERTTSRGESLTCIFCQRCRAVTIPVAFALATRNRSLRRPRLHRVYTSRRVEAPGPGSRVKFANGIYILAHLRQTVRSITHLRDTERRHLP